MSTRPVISPVVFGSAPLNDTTPFTYRDSLTYQEKLQALQKYLNETIVSGIDAVEDWVEWLFQLINNKSGNLPIEYVDLVENYTIEIDPTWPDSHIHYIMFRQNVVGGWDITPGANITGSLAVEQMPEQYTLAWLVPRGDGSWELESWDTSVAKVVNTGVQTRAAITALIGEYDQENIQPQLDALETTLIAAMTDLESQVNSQIDTLTSYVNTQVAETRTYVDTEISETKTYVDQSVTNPDLGVWKDYDAAKDYEFPRANLLSGIFNGALYEVVTVATHGKRWPHLMKRMIGNNIEDSLPKDDGFIVSPSESMTSPEYHAKSGGAGITFNCTGYQTQSGITPPQNMLRGVQILNGKIYRDFEPASNRGRHSLGWTKDGELKPYSISWGDSAASMIADGVLFSYGFGPILVRNGAGQDIEALTYYGSLVTNTAKSARTLFGQTADGDLKLISVVGKSDQNVGLGGNELVTLCQQHGMYNAVMLDGGGSAQAVMGGFNYHQSSDITANRSVPDVGMIMCSADVPSIHVTGGAQYVTYTDDWEVGSSTYAPRATNRDGTIHVEGNLDYKPEGGLPLNEWTDVGLMPMGMNPGLAEGTGAFFVNATTQSGYFVRVQIRYSGQISVMSGFEGVGTIFLNCILPAR